MKVALLMLHTYQQPGVPHVNVNDALLHGSTSSRTLLEHTL